MAPLLLLAHILLLFCWNYVDAGRKKEPKPEVAISKFNPGGQYVMLTFDDGPHHGVTPRVLDILREKKVKATFFLMGSQLRKSPHLVQRIHREGHDIQNNGWKRQSASFIDVRHLGDQVNHTSHVIENLLANTTIPRISKKMAFYRPYDGVSSEAIVRHMSANGIKVVLWSLEPDRSASAANLAELAGKVKPGDVIRLHNSPATVEALPHLIDALLKEFYEFLTIAQVHSYPDDSPK